MNPPPNTYSTIQDYALYRGVCKRTVRNWMHQGMPVFRMGRIVRVRWAEADAWLAAVTSPRTRAKRPR
jgi:excisionase family DNA binding protein